MQDDLHREIYSKMGITGNYFSITFQADFTITFENDLKQ